MSVISGNFIARVRACVCQFMAFLNSHFMALIIILFSQNLLQIVEEVQSLKTIKPAKMYISLQVKHQIRVGAWEFFFNQLQQGDNYI